MKVISIKEPYATLIKENIKNIETRSWKTNYRGEIYIHASKTSSKITDTKILELTKNLKMSNGNIIAKATLVDCKYMDQEFINEIKQNKTEYLCGEYKKGRYAWILKDIEKINPIKAKGKLNIWNYEKETN